jgi:endoglucanase
MAANRPFATMTSSPAQVEQDPMFLALILALTTTAEPPAANKELGRGINLGNALEAPKEGEWGLKLEAGYFTQIKAARFDTVRVPVRWSAHAAEEAPYTIDAGFFQRIDWVLDQCEANKLNAVLNVHHYDALDKNPDKHGARLLGLWQQIATRYKDRPPCVYFELYNEPHDKLTADKWNDLVAKLLAEVRKTNPTRPVIVGPVSWNSIRSLPQLKLPEDKNLIVTVHYYEPMAFTHQGAEWASPNIRDRKGVTWQGTDAQIAELRKALDAAAKWAKANERPIFLGEFGAYSKADMTSRAKWTRAVAREAEARGFSWAYWEFAAGFGAYDKDKKHWREPLLKALVGN